MSAITASLQVRRYSHGKRQRVFAKDPTPTQALVLAYMREVFESEDQLPPVANIAEHFGWKSASAAQYYVDGLIRIGRLEKNALGKLRFARAKKTEGEPC